jgi:uroporphyrinogen III methyltransferase / synthase
VSTARSSQPTLAADSHPLAGRVIILTRPDAQARDFEARVRALGGEPLVAPAIAIEPPESWTIADAALRRLGTYDWVAFTSANAVRALVDRADAIGIDRDLLRTLPLAVVGPVTAAVAADELRRPDVVPSVHTAEGLAEELKDIGNGRVLLPRGDLAGDALPDALRARGAFVDEVVVYQTVPGPGVPTIAARVREGTADALLFASASAVRFVADALEATGQGNRGSWPLAVCLGPVTADAARSAGFTNVVVAAGATQNDLIDRAAHWFAHSE